MTKRTLLVLLLLLVACCCGFAQRGGGGGGGGRSGGGDSAGGGGGGSQSGPTHPKAKTPDETEAVKALSAVYNDSSTTGDQMDKAIADFVTKYPKSDYIFQVDRLGLQYYASAKHADPGKAVDYAQKALKIVPNDTATMTLAGSAVPRSEKADDPNLAVNLDLADHWNDKVISAAKVMDNAGSGGGSRGGHGGGGGDDPDVAKAKAAKTKQEVDQLEYEAYKALARSADLRKAYPVAQQNYAKALTVADWDADHADLLHAEIYLYLAQTQENAGQWADASSSLGEAAKFDSASPALQKLVSAEQDKVKSAGH